MIFRLDERILFPDPELAEEDGLLAVGGDLSAERLLLAYRMGIFPWYSRDEPILWFSPHERMVIYPAEIKVSGSMRKVFRQGSFTITKNKCFSRVLDHCASVKREGQDGTWITDDMKSAYLNLNKLGFAHSFEVWHKNELAGGLYGVETGHLFCGESMFSLVSNASKAALIYLSRLGNYNLIECQLYTPHLESMGGRLISRQEYMKALHNGI